MRQYSTEKLVDFYIHMGIPKSKAYAFVHTLSDIDIAVLLSNPNDALTAIKKSGSNSIGDQLQKYTQVPDMSSVNNALRECFTNNGWDNDPLVKQLGKELREKQQRWDKKKQYVRRVGWLVLSTIVISLSIIFLL